MNEYAVKKQMESNFKLMQRKNAAYGSQNIDLTGLPGIAVRLLDKVMRLKTLVLEGHEDDLGEAVADTLQDIANYAVIGQLVESGQWSQSAPSEYEQIMEGIIESSKQRDEFYRELEMQRVSGCAQNVSVYSTKPLDAQSLAEAMEKMRQMGAEQ